MTSTEIPEGYLNVTILRQDGAKEEHLASNNTATSGFWKLFDFDVEYPGLFVLSAYNYEGAWANDRYIERSYPLHTYAKSFIAGPNSDFFTASKPLGQKIEILPLDNITQIGKGDFQFQVLFDSMPFDNITVAAEKVGNDSKISDITDKDGKVKFNLNDSSEFSEWIIAVDTLMDQRVVEPKDLTRGSHSNKKTYVGPVYRSTLVVRTDYLKPSD